MNSDNNSQDLQGKEMDADISSEERHLLDESIENSFSRDNENLKRSALDNTDEEGVLLNEDSSADDYTGEDLDIPGADLDAANERIGKEDEENNGYSEADTE